MTYVAGCRFPLRLVPRARGSPVLIACWSSKGGSGTTVVACALALSLARSSPTGAVLADLGGDAPAVLGCADPTGPGLADWLAADGDVGVDALDRLAVDAAPNLRLLPLGSGPPPATSRFEVLAAELAGGTRPTVVDCGPATGAGLALAGLAGRSVLVIRPCYLALRRALAAPVRPSEVVVVRELGRSLTRSDVQDVLGVPVRAEVPYDPAVARAVDAGVLARRMPRQLERAVRLAA